jgi:predicted ATPase
VLILWEDVQWSDPTTRESLELLIDHVPTLRVLVIITFRPEFSPPWVGRPHVTMLNLNRLPPRQRVEMIAHVTGGKALPKEIADQIVDRTDGVPLFIEELTKSVIETGMVAEAGDHYAAIGPVAPLAIPASLHASLLARLDRLAATREVAQIAAALGRQFSHELISAVTPISSQQLDDALDQLVIAELIFRRGSPPDAEYTFKHALVQDAAYGTLLKGRRQQIHKRIANTLQERFPDIVVAQPALLAQHCTEAGLTEKAVGYWLNAGQQSVARSAMTEPVAQLQKGLDLLSSLPGGTQRHEQELDLQITIGQALLATKGYSAPEPGEAFARARQLCEQLNRPAELGPIMAGQFVFRLVRGQLDQAEQHADEIRHLGDNLGDLMWQSFGSMYSGVAHFFLGKFIDARVYLENALSSWDPRYRAVAVPPGDPYLLASIFLYRTLVCLGHLDRARMRRDETLAEARRLSPYNLAFTLRHAWYGDWAIEGVKSAARMLRSAEEVSAIASEQGFHLFFGVGNIMRGWCLGTMDGPAEGISLLLQGFAMRRVDDAKLMIPFHLTTLAEVYGKVAQPEEGLNRLAEAANLVETTQERWVEGEIHRLRGTLLQSMNEHTTAEESFRRAITVAQRQGAKFWELRAALDLARLWRDQDKPSEARDLLAPVYGWFTEGFDTPVLQDAKALLDELA